MAGSKHRALLPPIRFSPNLRLTVLHARDDDERRQRLIDLVQQLAGAGVVYAQSRQQCEELASLLRSHGVVAGHYHAGVEDRGTLQDRFKQNELRVIVATVAFGMGVDKPDIRWIIHMGLPGSVEAYSQEIGRAGRDGATADCVLLHCLTDDQRLLRLSQQSPVSLESAHAMLQRIMATLGAAGIGPVPLDDLTQATNGDQTAARAVLSVLEVAGLVRRHYDAPDHVLLRRDAGKRKRQPDSACLQFMHQIGLATHDAANGAFVTLASKSGIPLVELETALLQWQDQGWLQYFPSGRRLLLSVGPVRNDRDGQIAHILEQRRAAAAHRAQGIIDFVNSTHCRHGALANYLGDTPRNRCNVCDNCGAGLVVHASPASAALEQQTITVLRALAEQSWGKRTLVRLLHGDAAAGERAHESVFFGALSDRSEQSLSQLVDSLIAEGLIGTRTLSHGGATLELSHRGQQALHQRPVPRSITGRR
ncbi:MAG: RecQ family zinc-binding domain-containing protein [Anaerolineales bacterium]|nr:RecQ family zinc-binding domain-containing protein [Anaerolineales bacterium]